jgi:foldase protein PrsA
LREVAPRIAQEAFQSLVLRVLLLGAIEAEQVEVADEEVKARLEKVKEALPEDRPWEELLQEVKMTETELEENLRNTMRIDKLLRSQIGEIPPATEDEIATFYEENKERFVQPEMAEISHLLIKVAEDAEETAVEEARKRAESLLGLAKEDVELNALAAKYSEDEKTKDKGGYLGKIPQGGLTAELDRAVFAAEAGTFTDVVRSPVGFHVVRVESREPSRQRTLEEEEVSKWISARLAEQSTQERLRAYAEKLREQADIQIREAGAPFAP